jgi:hypothetical protein
MAASGLAGTAPAAVMVSIVVVASILALWGYLRRPAG